MLTEKVLEDIFGTADLYSVLGVDRSATGSKIKKAYHRKSLELHPDRQENEEDKEKFTEKFQYLHKAYQLLSDKDRRAEYDEHGTLEMEDDGLLGKARTPDEWSALWRSLFKPVTKEDVVKFEGEYKGSEAERGDVKRFYTQFKGDMDKVMESVMLVTFEDEDRIRGIINQLIEDKEVSKYKAYTKEDPKKRKRREKTGKKEAKEAADTLNDQSSLINAIANRQAQRGKQMESLFANLEEKYCQPSKKRKRK